MNKQSKSILFVSIILLVTILTLTIIHLIPDFSKQITNENENFNGLKWWLVFLIADLILIGIPLWLHREYVNDYSKIKNISFFSMFGAVTGVIFGEGGKIAFIPGYFILMLIYALFYKKFIWWKVVITTYLTGILLENIMMRSPIQPTTLIWIALLTYPYFITKIFDNRKKLNKKFWNKIWNELKWTILASLILPIILIFINFIASGVFSPPLLILGIATPFVIKIIKNFIKSRNGLLIS